MERLVVIARPEVPFARFDHPQAPEAVIGRRRCLAGPGGRGCLIHWLEAGQETNMPIIFLHTAGADARQYLYQLGDSCLQRQFRMLAFDMPWHGHSGGEDDAALPEGYRLSEAVYGGWVASFIAQVAEGPVILVGCSMGAAIALAVTAQRPDLTWAFRCQRLAFGHMMVLRLFQDPRSEPECMTRPGSGHDQSHIRSRRRPLGLSARSRIPLAAGWARAEETNLEHGSCQTRVRPGSSTRIRRG